MKPPDDDAYQALALAAHELRSPASVVAGHLRMLLKGASGELTEPQRKALGEISRSSDRILQLIRELSDFAALTRGAIPVATAPVEIFALCDEVVQATVRDGAGEMVFSCLPADRPTLVSGNAEGLRRALGGLIAAVRRENGAVALGALGFVDREQEPSRAVIVFGNPDIVSAAGESANGEAHVFDRWRGGTGMSVPIACRIIETHGGRVWSPSGDSHGSAALSLPLAQTA